MDRIHFREEVRKESDHAPQDERQMFFTIIIVMRKNSSGISNMAASLPLSRIRSRYFIESS